MAVTRPLVFALALAMTVLQLAPLQAALPMLDDKRGVLTIAPLLESTTPGVVNISVRTRVAVEQNPLMRDPFFRRFFGIPNQPSEREAMSAGSGVIVDAAQGYVLTNHHVIDNAASILITLKDKRQFKAKLIGSDPGTDIALLQIPEEDLTAVPMGDSGRIQVGDVVIAIGNPFGIGQTVTSGIVSALGRSGLGIEGYEDFIQTDASINPGNSGGALINSKGELIGINTAIIGPGGGNVGIGFAVPSNMARAVLTQLARYGEVRRGRLGVAIQDLTPEIAEALAMPHTGGAIVSHVEPDSPAAKAGLRPGDVVVAVNDRTIHNSADLRNQVGLVRKGDTVTVRLLRDGRALSLTVQIGDAEIAALAGDQALPEFAGAVFDNAPADEGRAGGRNGVAVRSVETGSPAWRYGLRKDDLITAVNRAPTRSLADFTKAVKQAGPIVALNILRNGNELFLVVQR